MRATEVFTKEDLEKAVAAGYDEIVVTGDFAEQLATAYKVKKYSKVAIAVLGTALATIVFAGPVGAPIGMALAAPVFAVTGMEVSVIIAVIMVGFALIILVSDKYEIELEIGQGEHGNYRVKLIKKNRIAE